MASECDKGATQISYEETEKIAKFIKGKIKDTPLIGTMCGSGLGGLAECLKSATEILYEDIPNFPISTVPGHSGKFVFGYINKAFVMLMKGRFHYYEGYSMEQLAIPVRVMKLLGAKFLLVTNSAGSINPKFDVGDVMLIKDHVGLPCLAGHNPLRGPNDTRFGPRFTSLAHCYCPKLREMANQIGIEQKLNPKVGVYGMQCGPTYETVAEIKLMHILNVDAIGMSTVPEVMVARHCGMRVLGFSFISNKCALDYDVVAEPSHEEVLEAAKGKEDMLLRFFVALVEKIATMH